MKKKRIGCLVFFGLIAIICLLLGLHFKDKKKDSLTSNNNEPTIYSTKPELYYFYADYCSACRKFKPLIEQIAEEFTGEYIFKPINVMNPKNYEITRQYNVRSIPGIFLVNPVNNKRIQLDLLYNEKYFREEMKKFYIQPIR